MSNEDDPVYAGPYGQLTPVGGGDAIPLMKDRLVIGRRDDVDIQLNFSNVSSKHCRMTVEHGYWFIRDLNSRNGTKVDKMQIMRKRLDPGCKLAVARHEYTVDYNPNLLGAYGPPPTDDEYMEELMRSSLLGRAGMDQRSEKKTSQKKPPGSM